MPCRHPTVKDAHYYGQNSDPGESYKGLTGNDSRYYGLQYLLRNYGHFRATIITVLLVWFLIKWTPRASYITQLCKITVCCSSLVKMHFKTPLECLFSHQFFSVCRIILASQKMVYVIHVEGTFYFTPRYYGLSLLRTLKSMSPSESVLTRVDCK